MIWKSQRYNNFGKSLETLSAVESQSWISFYFIGYRFLNPWLSLWECWSAAGGTGDSKGIHVHLPFGVFTTGHVGGIPASGSEHKKLLTFITFYALYVCRLINLRFIRTDLFTEIRCWGSGSVSAGSACFWSSRIRIH